MSKYILTPFNKSPSKMAKHIGLDSLTEVSDVMGVSLQTLTNWHKNKHPLFCGVIVGAAAILEKGIYSIFREDEQRWVSLSDLVNKKLPDHTEQNK